MDCDRECRALNFWTRSQKGNETGNLYVTKINSIRMLENIFSIFQWINQSKIQSTQVILLQFPSHTSKNWRISSHFYHFRSQNKSKIIDSI